MKPRPQSASENRAFGERVERIYDELYPRAKRALGDLLHRLGHDRAAGPATLARGLSVRNIGRAAGKCSADGSIIVNVQLAAFPDDVRDTVAHELAHAVVETARLRLARAGLGARRRSGWRDLSRRTGPWASHGAIWREVALQLGDSGDRCHTLPLEPVRRTRRYLYRADCGTEMVLSAVRHNRLQREPGFAYHWPRKGVSVCARHFVGEVGQE